MSLAAAALVVVLLLGMLCGQLLQPRAWLFGLLLWWLPGSWMMWRMTTQTPSKIQLRVRTLLLMMLLGVLTASQMAQTLKGSTLRSLMMMQQMQGVRL
jgi:hypothetical protein